MRYIRLAPVIGMNYRRALLIILTLTASIAGFQHASSEVLRFASSADATTLDPHSQAVTANYQVLRQVYEPLVGRDVELNLISVLAATWRTVEPDRWRFTLRDGVKFHDGSAFTADDVGFSINRIGNPASSLRNYVSTIVRVEVVDRLNVDIVTNGPDPALPDKLTLVPIMSRVWSEAHGSSVPQSATGREEIFASRNANGTGPYLLVERSPGVRTVLARFDGWWGTPKGNVTQYISTPISSAATRIAALLSGAVDFVPDPPLQDIPRLEADSAIKLQTGPENRTMLLVPDQGRDELLYSDVKGKNPFKDRRVRHALYQAIDVDTLVSRILRKHALPTGVLFPPGIRGYAKDLDTRLAYDPEASKRLLSEAGYPEGFGFTLDCPNNRYQSDEAVCQAIVAMWAKVGVRATLNSMPIQAYLPKVQKKDTSMFLIGVGSPSLDAYFSFQVNLLSRPGEPEDGLWSLGYHNDRINDLATQFQQEIDPKKRDALIWQGLTAYKEDIANLPLYHSVGAWAMRENIDATYRADGLLEVQYVTVK